MIKIFYGDSDRLDLHGDYIKYAYQSSNKTCQILFDDCFTLDNLYTSYFQQDIFGSNKKNVDVLLYYCSSKLECDNLERIKHMMNSKKHIYIIGYSTPPNANNLIKTIGKNNFFELKTIHDGFGGYSKKEYQEVYSIIAQVIGNENTIDIHKLITEYKYGGVIKTINNIKYLNLPMEYVFEQTELLNEYFLMSITNAIQEQNNDKIYHYINHPNIKYDSILMVLQKMFGQMSKVLHAYKNENYEVDFNSLNERVKDANKYSMYRNLSYMKFMGHEKIDYVYGYLNMMLVHLTNSSLPYSDKLKLQDLGRVIRGEKSIFNMKR